MSSSNSGGPSYGTRQATGGLSEDLDMDFFFQKRSKQLGYHNKKEKKQKKKKKKKERKKERRRRRRRRKRRKKKRRRKSMSGRCKGRHTCRQS